MNTKLTLTLEQSVIESAKRYAQEKGRSLSDIIENYLRLITQEKTEKGMSNTPLINSLKGTFKAPKEMDYKKELSKTIAKKYL